MNNLCRCLSQKRAGDILQRKKLSHNGHLQFFGLFGEVHGFVLIGEAFGQVHQLVGSTEVDMYKMSVIEHISNVYYLV